ncbi:hypothetical protein INT44_005308 [Umbelopsis vinacea]|uniref:Uncharacterized protein n=1 Tax=Umbelopsis vinacea TaxID=44442 RepID=A0A8H7Q6Y6_9FUNG|nr:hypothetical protein INT44_005308 [Umbelopsis vinacea]
MTTLQRNGRGLANSLKWLYINIFMIVIVEIISIIFLATTRSSAIITGCQYNHLDQISTLDYLTNPLNAALEVNSGCHRYWVHIVLLGCVYVIRMYLNELQDSNEEYVIGMNQTMQDVEDEYKPMVPDFKYHSWKQDPTEDTNRDLYDSRATLYSKIYQKNVLRQKDYMKQSLGSLHPPEYTPQPNIKSPTLERMEYSRFKEHGAGHVPLEREGMNLSPGEPLPTNPSDPLADASEPSVDPSDSLADASEPSIDPSDLLADRSDSPGPENDRLLRR